MHSLRDIYMKDPQKTRGLTDLGKASIVGIESPVWTEYITDFKKLNEMCFPRWMAVAERAWNQERRPFADFLKTAQFFCDILKEMGVTPAQESEWNILPHTRLEQTLGFVKNNVSKQVIKEFFRGKKK